MTEMIQITNYAVFIEKFSEYNAILKQKTTLEEHHFLAVSKAFHFTTELTRKKSKLQKAFFITWTAKKTSYHRSIFENENAVKY